MFCAVFVPLLYTMICTRGISSVYRKYHWYIADIDISVSVSNRHFRYWFFI